MSKTTTVTESHITPLLQPVVEIPGVNKPQLDADVSILGGSGGGGGHVIQEEGTPLDQRANMNFTGDGVTAIDDSENDRTNIVISAPAIDPYGRDSSGFFKVPVGDFMYE